MKTEAASPRIGTLGEKSLHAAIKAWYGQPGDRYEVSVDGFVADIVRGKQIIEIQTRNFSAIKRKLGRLAAEHRVRLVYPIAREKWLVTMKEEGDATGFRRRKSPKRGSLLHLFHELIRIPHLIALPNFSIEVLIIREEELRRSRSSVRWRRKPYTTCDRQLVTVLDRVLLESPADYLALLPESLPDPFTNAELAHALGQPRHLAERMTYCLRAMGVLTTVGKRRNALLHARASEGDAVIHS